MSFKCKEHGDTIIKVPFHRTGYYCPDCHPAYHTYLQKEKTDRLAKMNFGKKKTKLVGLLNSFAEKELGG